MYKNHEGYADPTAGRAILETTKEEDKVAKKNHKMIEAFRAMADCAGFSIEGRIILKHKKSGRVFR